MPERDDELYTGYLPRAPAGVAAHVRRTVVILAVLTAGLAVALTVAQNDFSEGVYEFLVLRDVEGVVRERPVPQLEVDRPGANERSRFYLVAPGKLGAGELVAGLDGRRVRLRGSLLYRDDQTMVEVAPGSIETLDGGRPEPVPVRSLGEHALAGRIVDSKCFLGIMKPASGKTHRACATRCISGGIPPLFVLADGQGPARYLLLVGSDGRAVGGEVLDKVDEPLEIRGEVVRRGDLLELRADPEGYRRLP